MNDKPDATHASDHGLKYHANLEDRIISRCEDGLKVPVMKLNEALIVKQGLTEDAVAKILDAHVERLILLDSIEAAGNSGLYSVCKNKYVEYITNQFKLQMLWGFECNENFHDWYAVPHCTCPKLDNFDRKGTPYRIYTEDCPIHNAELVATS